MRDGAQDYVIKGNLRRLAPAVERELRELGVRRKRREAEEALHAAERRLHHVVDATPSVIYLMSVEGTTLKVTGTSKERMGIGATSLSRPRVVANLPVRWSLTNRTPAKA